MSKTEMLAKEIMSVIEQTKIENQFNFNKLFEDVKSFEDRIVRKFQEQNSILQQEIQMLEERLEDKIVEETQSVSNNLVDAEKRITDKIEDIEPEAEEMTMDCI